MSDFKKFKAAVQNQFDNIIYDEDRLFVADVSKDEMWNTYLDSFPEGSNPIFKERREFDCNYCRQFIKAVGNVVAIKDNKIVSIWDNIDAPYPFDIVANKMSDLITKSSVRDIFVTKEFHIGVNKNRQILEDDSVCVWEHFYYKLPGKFVTSKNESIGAIQGTFRDSRNVFKRSMEELTLEAGETIKELILQNSIYRGEEHKGNINSFIEYKKKYNKLPKEDRDNWCWKNSINNPVVRIRNTALGTLLIDISNNIDLDFAVKKFEKVMAPTNYKRPKAIFTKKMVQEAKDKIKDLGFENSLGRRSAILEDISINDVLFTDSDARKKMNNDAFEELMDDVPENPKSFNKVEEITVDNFIENIIPTANSIEVMMEGSHVGNLVSLIAPQDPHAPSMFKWGNNFSWDYNGNVADSMKQNVKNAGGNVEGVLRFSIQWNENGKNNSDFDAHCIEPLGNHIYYSNKVNRTTTGNLDVDIINPNNKIAVENITWLNENKMQEGYYKFFVNNFSKRGNGGFKAEIEYNGDIYAYEYDKSLKSKEKVQVATILYSKRDGIKFIKSLDSSVSSKEVWGVKTHKFQRVSTIMLSPNCWDYNDYGNKHLFFFIDGCKNDNVPRGFYNEFLTEELIKHKRVFEALGSKMEVERLDSELSGLGFSSTQHNSVVVRVKGNTNRVIKVNF